MTHTDVLELHRRQPRRHISPQASTATDAMPAAAAILPYVGALPLIVSALAITARPELAAPAAAFMTLYGGALIAFFGGVRWGVAVMKPGGPTMRALLGGAIPLVAALPVFLPAPAPWTFAYIIAALALMLVDDLRATRAGSGAPAWYLGVRTPLTMLMAISYVIALMTLIRS